MTSQQLRYLLDTTVNHEPDRTLGAMSRCDNELIDEIAAIKLREQTRRRTNHSLMADSDAFLPLYLRNQVFHI